MESKSIKIKYLLPIIIFLAVLFSLLTPSSAQAVETGALGLIPAHPNTADPVTASWFVYEAKPGSVIEDAALIKNHDLDNPVTVRIYAVDGTTTTNGVFALTLATDQQSGIGAWVEVLPPKSQEPAGQEAEAPVQQEGEKLIGLEINVPAGQNVEVPFKLKVPENASVGDHTGGLVIETAPKKAEGTGFSVVTRIGARIYLTVPGEKVYSLKIKDFNWKSVDYTSEELKRLFLGKVQRLLGLYRKGAFFVTLDNLGNVQLGTQKVPLKGKLIISNIVNQIIDEKEVELGTILPKGEITQTFTWKRNNPLFLRYQANLEVTYAKDKPPKTSTTYFWVIPWPLVLSLGILVVLIIIIYFLHLLIREKRKRKMVQYTVQDGDTLKKVSAWLKIKPKKIVKINRMKFPYEINPGEKLFIPKIKQEELDKIVAERIKSKEKVIKKKKELNHKNPVKYKRKKLKNYHS